MVCQTFCGWLGSHWFGIVNRLANYAESLCVMLAIKGLSYQAVEDLDQVRI